MENTERIKVRVTQSEVARIAGVSRGTVDRALNGRKDVNENVKQKIIRIAKELDYRPNRVAQLLVKKTTKFIGAVYPENPSFFWDQVSDGMKSAQNEFEGFGLHIEHRRFEILKENSEKELKSQIDYLAKKPLDALIVMPIVGSLSQNIVKSLADKGVIILTLTFDFKETDYASFHIGPDLKQRGRAAAHLISQFLKGKGKVLCIKGSDDENGLNQTNFFRFVVFQDYIKENYPGIKLYSVDYKKNMSYNEQQKIIETINSPTNKWDGIYVTEGEFLAEVGSLIKDLNLVKNPIVIGHEINSKVDSLLKEDIVTATVCQQPYMEGYYAIKILYEYLVNNKSLTKDFMYTNLNILTKETVSNHDAFTKYFKLFKN